jgi:trigger factor
MKVEVVKTGPCRRVMHVEAPADAVAADYEAVASAYRKAAKLPGFRPGKAPAAVVEKRYADKILEDVQDRAVPRLYHEALKNEAIDPMAIVAVDGVSCTKDAGLSFKVTLDVEPEFKLPKYRKITVKDQDVTVADQDVDDAFQRFLRSHSRFESVEGRSVKHDDLVQIDYDGVCDGKPVREIAPGEAMVADGKDFWAVAGEPEFLPGFAAAVEGAEVGRPTDLAITFPDDYRVKALAGREAVYTVEVKAVRERALPELDEAFFKPLGVKDEAELRDRIRKDLEGHRADTEKARQRDEVVQFLLEKTKCDLPEAVVEREKNNMLRDAVQRLSMQGLKEDQIRGRQAELLASAERAAGDRVKLSLILKRIADEESLEVADSEVDEQLSRMAQQYRVPVEQVRSRMEERDQLDGFRNEIRAEKTLDFLLENAKVK